MLDIVIPGMEMYDEVKEEFSVTKEQRLRLCHSLVSISKWESRWEKAFLTGESKSLAETMDYVRCMCVTQNIPDDTFNRLTREHVKAINDYIEAPMTATVITDQGGGSTNREVTTSEVIYYYMVALDIPFECQKWHLNRLLTLIHVCNIKSKPPEKMSRREVMIRNRSLNESRRAKMNTKG